MKIKTQYIKNLQKLYQCCIATPNLWVNDSVHELEQLELPTEIKSFNLTTRHHLRLGKLVERFITFQLNQDVSIRLLAENIQVQNGTRTVGEIDCLIQQKKQPIHLEIIYKFYLYDTSVGSTEIEHWIGPNRNDTFVKKLNKLKEKQLPLLYNRHTMPYLNHLNLEADSILQKVCFKAQLFVPLKMKNKTINVVNNDCIQGTYLKRDELKKFQDCKFFMPEKLEWLLEVHPQVSWKTYNAILKDLTELLNRKKSPIIWIKHPNGTIEKCFLVWW